MKIIVVLISWTKMNGLDMSGFANNIVAKMTGNASFPTPPFKLDELTTAANRAATAYANRLNGDAGKLENEAALEALSSMLYTLAAYVNTVSSGDATIIVGAGFEATKDTHTSVSIPLAPTAVKAKALGGGSLSLSTDKVADAESYVYVAFLGDDTFIVDVHQDYVVMPPSSIRTIVITRGGLHETIRGLTPGTKVYVQVLAQNSAGKSPFTPLICVYIS